MRVAVFTLGCKVNQYESMQVVSRLTDMGFDAVAGLLPADLYVINTCSVTSEADKKSRQAVSRVLKLNSAAKIIIIGCSSQNNAAVYKERPEIIAVFGTASKPENVENAAARFLNLSADTDFLDSKDNLDKKESFISNECRHKSADSFEKTAFLPTTYQDGPIPLCGTKTRAYVKIQDGCNNFCSYCIVPYLRGRSRSRSVENAITEIKALSGQTREIVLTGIDISAYGEDTGTSLTELIRAIGALKNNTARLRLGSLECGVIDDGLLSAMKEAGFCDHFHVSLQSGSKDVLRRMNRHYTPQEFLDKISLIRKSFPYAGITTDVIAGFLGETEKEHEETKQFLISAAFSDMHVFEYSPRAGTRAYALPQLEKRIREDRARELSEIKNKLKTDFINKNLGTSAQVYAEQRDKGFAAGFTSNYIKVYTKLKTGELNNVRLTQAFRDGAMGE